MAFEVETTDRTCVVDVTDEVATAVPDDATGTASVFVPHTTAGVVVNEPESGLLADIEAALSRIVPDDDYEHDRIDDNAAAHLRALVLGESVTVPITDGRPDLGTWQSILFVECDGPRTRRVRVVA